MIEFFLRIGSLIVLVFLSNYLGVPNLNDTWFYYLFSSIFQGLAALLGLLLASFVFLRQSIEQMQSITPIEHLSLKPKWIIIEISLALLTSIIGLWITPFLLLLELKFQLKVTAFIVGLTIVALFDITMYMLLCIKLDVSIAKIIGRNQD